MVWDELLDESELHKGTPNFLDHLKRYEALLKKHRLLTFGRLIYEGVQNLKQAPNTLSYISHLIVDEYQDINHAQSELIRYISVNSSLFVVGDPRQSIYQWRGSDEKYFHDFSSVFLGVNEISIPENRRSGKTIVSNANTFASSFLGTRMIL